MRIISGTHKGRRIMAPKNLPVRPTTDMAKEALFNILRHQIHIPGTKVLELFAGSGNMSYEFASRGAAAITAVDQHYPCISFIKKTAETLEFPIDTIKADVFSFLTKHRGTYDLIFADPPYGLEQAEFHQLADLVMEAELLAPGGIFIMEHSKHTNMEEHPHLDNSRRYGGTVFSFFNGPEEEE
ncbi:16S rRNA (guanine(966)-N(2))-methyltransferase RsmD [Nonlabens xiamenensis]|uniref:16S rRNA (guanine(966)-N(2))-methyltransferase RsmD n=1 Tax=Nonlabens xiamenensis TaxID=2341043 RepID=UPI000F61081B|nr:16S rRNA (guanine(966)-N(2))-methyltransferase RsmD [Nonlabens xiamenensis]